MRSAPINKLVKGQAVLDLIEEGYEVFIKTDFIHRNFGLIFQGYEHFKSNTPFKSNFYINFSYDQMMGKFYRENTYNDKGENSVAIGISTEHLTCFVIQNNLYLH